MATGDILSIEIDSNGWQALITLEGEIGGGSWDLGYSFAVDTISNTTENSAIIFALTSVGYDTDGTANTKARTIYGTKAVRKPDPDADDLDYTESGNTIYKIALSDCIYDDDTSVSVTVDGGIYDNVILYPSSSYSGSVTNSSTAVHQSVIANWSLPGWREVEDDGSLRLSCAAFHQSATDGNMGISAVKFTVEDEHSNAATKTIITPTATVGTKTALAVVEFIADFTSDDLSGLTAGDQLSCDFIAYPYVGDTPLDTSDAVNTGITPLYTTQYSYIPASTGDDKYYAYVDTAASGGTASTTEATALADPFATIAAAYNAIVAAHGTNADRGVIKLRNDQSHEWTGGSLTSTSDEKTYVTVDMWDYDTLGTLPVITDKSGGEALGAIYKIQNCEANANATGYFDAGEVLWLDICNLIDNATAPIYKQDLVYITSCDVDSKDWHTTLGTTTEMQVALSRDNIGKPGNSMYTSLGNIYSDIGTTLTLEKRVGGANALHDGLIVAYNTFNTSYRITIGSDEAEAYTMGSAFVQNVVECNPYATSEPALHVAADGIINNYDNFLFWNNVIVGQRTNMAYFDEGNTSDLANYHKKFWSLKNNIYSKYNIKSDTFNNPTDGSSGYRIGNWSCGYGVGYVGNIIMLDANAGSSEFINSQDVSGGGMGGFDGLNVIVGDGTAGARAGVIFADYQADYGEPGGGDYHLEAGSAGIGLAQYNLIPYDLEGNERSTIAGEFDAGAYAYNIESSGGGGGYNRFSGSGRLNANNRFNGINRFSRSL